MSLLLVKELSKNYGGVRALDDVSIAVAEGEVLAVVGDNGAGKSTFAKIIAGAVQPTEGQIFFGGQEVTFHGPEDARRVGIETVYQNLALVPDFNAAENLYFGREKTWLGVLRHAAMHRSTEEILSRLGIKLPDTRTPVRHLSGGQQQSIAIGRAVGWGQRLVILDEPTAALGVQESRRVLDLIKRMRSEGTAILVISHNMEHVLEVADRVMVLRRGVKVGDLAVKGLSVNEIVSRIVGGVNTTSEVERSPL